MPLPTYLNAMEVARLTQTCKGTAYILIRELNEELKQLGFKPVKHKVNAVFFSERMKLSEEQIVETLSQPAPKPRRRKKKTEVVDATSAEGAA